MTALNAFARLGGAYLIADTGHYDGAGRIQYFGTKLHASEPLRLAIGTTGRIETNAPAQIEAWLVSHTDQAAALESLPTLLRALVREDAEAAADGGCDGLAPGIRLAVVWWDFAESRGCAGVIATPELASGKDPFILHRLGTLFAPQLRDDPWPGHSFDPERDALALAGFQRVTPDDDGTFRVGGAMEIVAVTADGIKRSQVLRWPQDRAGRKIGERRWPFRWPFGKAGR